MTTIGKIRADECEMLQKAFRRRIALKELLGSLSGKEESFDTLYERIMADYIETSTQISKWWENYATANSVSYEKDDQWGVNFERLECYLM